jgi:benzoyl-CoA reductase subunit B
MATIQMPQSQKKPATVQKEDAMLLQKEMINRNYHELATAHETGRKVSATFVPGNLNELLMCFDFARSLPETNALQNGMRKKSGKMIMDAERDGHSEDVCTYVKADLGMMLQGEVGPTGEKLPRPDVLLLSYTGCFTFMKWFELVRQKYDCETVMLHVPYQGDGHISPNMREYVVKQLKEKVIPTLERVSGVKFDIDRLRQYMKESTKAEEDLVAVLHSAKNRPSPIDGYFGGVYYIGPIFTAFRGAPEATEYYRVLRAEIEERVRAKKGPVTPEGELEDEKYRLVVEGPPNWTHFRDFWKMFYEEGAVVVASTYS